MIEGILAFLEEVGHGVAARDVRQEPQSVPQDVEQADIVERHGRFLTQLQLVLGRRHVLAAHEVEPHLNMVLELELGVLALPLRREEHVEIELVRLGVQRDALDLLRHLVGEHDHARERCVRVVSVCGVPFGLGLLLVGVRPVEDLLLDELTAVECAERGSGQEQEVLGDDGQPRLVLLVASDLDFLMDGLLLVLGDRVEELLGVVAPCSEVVLVEHHEVPVLQADPLVPGLDVAVGVSPEVVLE